MEKSRLSYIYAGVAIFFWATIPTAFKICLAEMEILTMLAIATFTSTVALFLILAAEGKLKLIKQNAPKELLGSALLGFINPFVYYLILLKAYQLLPAQVAQPLNMIWPIILVFLSVPILKQKIPARSFFALFISFAGVYIISSQGNLFFRDHANLTGVLLATGSSVFWAFYFIMNVRDPRDEAVKLFLSFLFASVVLAGVMIITGRWDADAGTRGIISAVYIGLFEMGITFFLWLKALRLATSTDRVSNLVYLAPFLSLVFVHFILGEPLFLTTPAGLLLIVFGILIQSRRVRRN